MDLRGFKVGSTVVVWSWKVFKVGQKSASKPYNFPLYAETNFNNQFYHNTDYITLHAAKMLAFRKQL